MPVLRPSGRALLVASSASRQQPRALLEQLGYSCADADDPYAAVAELAKHPTSYRAIIISLSSLYREELAMISALRRRYPQIEVWLTHTDGRQAALAQAMSMGADGLLAEDGLHRIGISPVIEAPPVIVQRVEPEVPVSASEPDEMEMHPDEPILSADELRMLLQEEPSLPPGTAD
ncbi:MAG TPA: response regulator [Tepidisphaeraceae bacterium]|nr:response regulator [Tepidisphaeraceae bacterium]